MSAHWREIMDYLSLISNQVGRIVTWTGASSLTAARRGVNSCVVLLYHQVARNSRYCCAGSTVGPDVFAVQMKALRREYAPVSLAELISALSGESDLPPRAVHVTFDDGYRGIFTDAAPVLEAEGISASVYVCPSIVDGGVFWWDDLCDALRTAQVSRLSLDWTGRTTCLDVRRDHVNACTVVRRLISQGRALYPPTETVQWLRGVLRSSAPDTLPEMLSWQDLRELRGAGVVAGSHTSTHERLSSLTDDELKWQMVNSRSMIEQRTGEAVLALAFPYGGSGSYDSRASAAAVDAGYRVAFSGRFGIAHPRGELHDVPRVPISPNDGRALFASKLSGAFPVVYRFVQEHVPRALRRGGSASSA